MSLCDSAGMYIAQDTNHEVAYCKVKVNGPLGHFSGSVLIDTGYPMELVMSECKSFQLGITAETQKSACELDIASGTTCR